jgi:hypothetical protein
MSRRTPLIATFTVAAVLSGATPTAVASASAGEAAAAQALRPCKSKTFGPFRYTKIRTPQGLSCRTVHRKLKRWTQRGRLPKNQFGWYCWRQPAGTNNFRCTLGNGNAPTFRFKRRRAS